MFVKLKPGIKNPMTTWRIKNERNMTTSPTIAATMVFRAVSTPPLSPPERIHRIPPQIRNPRAIITEIMKTNVIAVPMIVPNSAPLILHNIPKSLSGWPVSSKGQILIVVAANAGATAKR